MDAKRVYGNTEGLKPICRLETLAISGGAFSTRSIKRVGGASLNLYRQGKQALFPTRLYSLKPPIAKGSGKPLLRRALLSYITSPFMLLSDDPSNARFSNTGLARTISEVLHDLGYVVDVVEYNDTRFKPRHKYDLFIGHGGNNFELIARALPRTCVKIYFSTGSYWKFSNDLELARLAYLYQRRGVHLRPDRLITKSEEWANANATGIIALGSPYVRESYAKFPHVINVNNAMYQDSQYDVKRKDYARGQNSFLFFAGAGNIHKGLDLLLDAFSSLDQQLYVCQTLSPEFARVYNRELTECANIHNVGHISLRSQTFYDLVNTCNFAILPSCGEGQPGSVIDCMQYGIIPVLSKESNLDTDGFGVTLNECTVEEIMSVVQDLASRPIQWQRDMAAKTRKITLAEYSKDVFYRNFRRALLEICERADARAQTEAS